MLKSKRTQFVSLLFTRVLTESTWSKSELNCIAVWKLVWFVKYTRLKRQERPADDFIRRCQNGGTVVLYAAGNLYIIIFTSRFGWLWTKNKRDLSSLCTVYKVQRISQKSECLCWHKCFVNEWCVFKKTFVTRCCRNPAQIRRMVAFVITRPSWSIDFYGHSAKDSFQPEISDSRHWCINTDLLHNITTHPS